MATYPALAFFAKLLVVNVHLVPVVHQSIVKKKSSRYSAVNWTAATHIWSSSWWFLKLLSSSWNLSPRIHLLVVSVRGCSTLWAQLCSLLITVGVGVGLLCGWSSSGACMSNLKISESNYFGIWHSRSVLYAVLHIFEALPLYGVLKHPLHSPQKYTSHSWKTSFCMCHNITCHVHCIHYSVSK